MMEYFKVITVVITLFAPNIWAGIIAGHHGGYAPHAVDYYSHPKYAFKYGVSDPHTGDHKQQTETRDGDVVKGQYSLVEPDGSVRTVDYTADSVNGFNAVVSKSAPSVHAAPAPVVPIAPVQPVVKVVQPVYKQVVPVPPIVQKQYVAEPLFKYTSPIGYEKGAYYGDYDNYAYPENYDIYDNGQIGHVGQVGQHYY
ncbi:unnamed protein product [Brassicogethes aeneus]|uniref:Uncharacterized protein n=1 Tax=Brassicogethes aeneus TaxID=1431903 RepID=A0A9P0FJN1_BRAAE|nr:unnamed protein product [Brassicogethes aeneus]